MSKPQIPKRLAARIRGAQRRVTEARWGIICGEYNAAQSQARLTEFECDPAGFAERHYRPYGVDSYPVQTNISRQRERLAYHESRKDNRLIELGEAEAALERVEAEVLAAVSIMRPSNGRVAWPRKLPTFEQYRERKEAEIEREDRESAERRAREDAQFEDEDWF